MSIKIDKKITGYNVVKPENNEQLQAEVAPETAEIIQMHEKI